MLLLHGGKERDSLARNMYINEETKANCTASDFLSSLYLIQVRSGHSKAHLTIGKPISYTLLAFFFKALLTYIFIYLLT
jgi:hypothetical protein